MTTTTQTTATTIFVNLFAALRAEKITRFNEFVGELNSKKDTQSILSAWQYNDLFPKGKKAKSWELRELINYLIDRKQKETGKYLSAQMSRLRAVENAPELESITISIEWKKSRMWGNNPNAEARVCTSEGCEHYNSGSIGGCGYDKQSTAVAQSVNQSNSFLKALYLIKEKNVTKSNHDLFGYGAGYGILPSLEGGVGVSCYPRIFEAIGFKFKTTASGKAFDVYTVTK
jgi:hypothetical protein